MRNQQISDPTSAKNKILAKAHELVMTRGYAGTSIDMILDATGLTKGAFFYHFKSKAALAAALAKRYVQRDNNYYQVIMRQVMLETDDPLDRMLTFLDRIATDFAQKTELPGCLFASYSYDAHGIEMAELMDEQVKLWRRYYTDIFNQIAERYPPKWEVSTEDLADYFLATIEGGYVMSRLNRKPDRIAVHIRQYINYLTLLFRGG